MDSKDFKELMVLHDSEVYPDYFEHGWDAAIKTVAKVHPGIVNAEDFPCPKASLLAGTYDEAGENEGGEEDRIINPEDSLVKSTSIQDQDENIQDKQWPREEQVDVGKKRKRSDGSSASSSSCSSSSSGKEGGSSTKDTANSKGGAS